MSRKTGVGEFRNSSADQRCKSNDLHAPHPRLRQWIVAWINVFVPPTSLWQEPFQGLDAPLLALNVAGLAVERQGILMKQPPN